MSERLHIRLLRDPVQLLALGFGTGLSPWAPGTAGSLLGVALAWASLPLPLAWRLLVGIALILSGIWICGASARRIGVHDHPGIVWDEIAAMYLVLLVVPPSPALWALGFGLFRLFDIWKPWPIRDLDHRLGGGLGIMLDDLVAALYAALLLGFYCWLTV
ncbi:MAG: phosphatidylglycerophosphatase A [Gammaproteobacteria bacterium]|nr:MAG: phosphatidylglycerophosphatase A [Gammaproteobacteria bacterium]